MAHVDEPPIFSAAVAALTGGIASGKSTVARMFQECGAFLIDADQIARAIVAPGLPAWHEIVAHFGTDILLPTQALDRKRLGQVIFHDPTARQMLNNITHPRVRAEIARQIQAQQQQQRAQWILVDVPLLIETGMHGSYACVIVVYIPEAMQIQRLIARDQLTAADARARIRAQMPLAAKCAYATQIVRNDGTLAQTRAQVCAIYQARQRKAGGADSES